MKQANARAGREPGKDFREWYAGLNEPRPLLVVISGPSGVGKDATILRLKATGYPCHFVVTATTRPRRPNEVDGVDYDFVSPLAFAEMAARGELLEQAEVYGQMKGIPRANARRALLSGRDVIMRIDIQGAVTVCNLVPQAVTIFLTAESDEALIERLRRRCTDDEEQIQRRIETARAEMRHICDFKYRVVNRECALDDTVEQVIAIMRSEKARVDWQPVML